MKKITLLFLSISITVFSQSSGDILFIGFNANGDKDFSIVAMKDLPTNTIIYFTDNGPNSTGNGKIGGTSEGVLKWNTGTSVISSGTVVTFTDIDQVGNANFGSSLGILTYPDAGFNISAADGDVIYATYGSPIDNTVTTWIAGLQNNNEGTEANFSQTGLSTTSNYVVIDNTASKDGGQFKVSLRSGQTSTAAYSALIVDEANWDTHTTDGESFLPFDTTPFTFSTLSVQKLEFEDVKISILDNKITSSKGTILKILNTLGQEIPNDNIAKGIYLVLVQLDGKLETFKIML